MLRYWYSEKPAGSNMVKLRAVQTDEYGQMPCLHEQMSVLGWMVGS
ncbi:MAG: hypothetical protein J6L69_03260 [Lachnospiraceae bacterium]|nr:hypothetical protein [Lachnospiraceae bacterium]